MCGLVARLSPGEALNVGHGVTLVSAAAEHLRHRGPDGSGMRAVGRAVLAHCRLSIVDIATGSQPLLSEDGRMTLVCNGEIYNHEILRARLKTRHTFNSESDSEIILHLYEEMGERCVAALDGMFAFVLTDGTDILAARDPFGIKPLYVGRGDDGSLWFASEIKALIGTCADIAEFPPGHLFTIAGGLRKWFEPPWEQPRAMAPFDPPALGEALQRAVDKRLMSDVPFGVALSGGLDSSVVAVAMRPRVEALHSFSVGTDGSPDLAAARQVAQHLGTHHHEYTYTAAETVSVLDTVIAHLESYDPALLRSAVPSFFVSRLAADHVKMVLTGEGADEIFAGYDHFATIDDPSALQRESIRLLSGLHNLNLQRVDRMTMAHGIEGRVPFLDVDFVDRVTAFDPRLKLHGMHRPEKWPLRLAFAGTLPDTILWRDKQEFAQGCGSEQLLRAHCETIVSDADFATAPRRFPVDTPRSKEAYHYRRIFEEMFPGESPRQTVGRWREPDVTEEPEIHA